MKVASVAREALDNLLQRPGPLTVTINKAASGGAIGGNAAGNSGAVSSTAPRRVSFGLVPDYAHQAAGVRAESVVPDSPGAKISAVFACSERKQTVSVELTVR